MKYKIKPWDHQLEAIERAKDMDNYALFLQTGTGKTSTCINIIRHKYASAGRLMKTLVIAPNIVLENWRDEILAHSNIKYEDIIVLDGPGKKRVKVMEQNLLSAKIVITGYSSLTMGAKRDKRKRRIPGPVFQSLLDWAPEILVLDESHRCKTPTTGRTKAATELGDLATHTYLLSGTPVLNSIEDIYAQFRILDGGILFGKNYFSFRGKYLVDRNAGMNAFNHFPNWMPREGSAELINTMVSQISSHVKKEDCLDLPPLVKKVIEVPLGPKQKKAYDSMHKELVAYIADTDTVAVAEFGMTRMLRLQQIVSGFVNTEDMNNEKHTHEFEDDTRSKALAELLEDVTPNHKVLIWAVFKNNYKSIRRVCEKLGIKYCEVHGEVSQKDKMSAVDSLNNDPSVRVLIGHPGSGGIGINLVASDYTIYYSRSFNLEFDIQSEARNYRGGSERHARVTRVDLVAPETIDAKVLEALASKKQIGYSVLKDMI